MSSRPGPIQHRNWDAEDARIAKQRTRRHIHLAKRLGVHPGNVNLIVGSMMRRGQPSAQEKAMAKVEDNPHDVTVKEARRAAALLQFHLQRLKEIQTEHPQAYDEVREDVMKRVKQFQAHFPYTASKLLPEAVA